MARCCDLNADLGESYGAWEMGDDLALLDVVSSCNVACGFHAGDPLTLRITIQRALARGVAIGAHPSLPDLVGFGRREMATGADELHAMTQYQVAAVQGMVAAAGGHLHHVKPHGALYGMLERDSSLAGAFVEAVAALDPKLCLYGPPQGALRKMAEERRLGYTAEGFADRGYRADGSLVPRRSAGAHLPLDAALAQGLALASGQAVTAQDGTRITPMVQTLCVHGDGAEAVRLAQGLRRALSDAGIRIAAP